VLAKNAISEQYFGMDTYPSPENDHYSDGIDRIRDGEFVELCHQAERSLYLSDENSDDQRYNLSHYGIQIRQHFGEQYLEQRVRVKGFAIATDPFGAIDEDAELAYIDLETVLEDITPTSCGEAWPTMLLLHRFAQDETDDGGYYYMALDDVLELGLPEVVLSEQDNDTASLVAFFDKHVDQTQKIITSELFLSSTYEGQRSMLDFLSESLVQDFSRYGLDCGDHLTVSAERYYVIFDDTDIDISAMAVDESASYYEHPSGVYTDCVFADCIQAPDKRFRKGSEFTIEEGNPCIVLVDEEAHCRYLVPISLAYGMEW
jgi:hypothetical protein